MGMSFRGYTKVIEETTELVTALAKKIAYWNAEIHPDGSNLQLRIKEELADTLAAIFFVIKKNNFNIDFIVDRVFSKYTKYLEWDKEEFTDLDSNSEVGDTNAS